jgi:hypothetical protein
MECIQLASNELQHNHPNKIACHLLIKHTNVKLWRMLVTFMNHLGQAARKTAKDAKPCGLSAFA